MIISKTKAFVYLALSYLLCVLVMSSEINYNQMKMEKTQSYSNSLFQKFNISSSIFTIILLVLGVILLNLTKLRKIFTNVLLSSKNPQSNKTSNSIKEKNHQIPVTKSDEVNSSDETDSETIYKKLKIIEGGFSHSLNTTYDVVKNSKITFPIKHEEDDIYVIEDLLTTQECLDLINNSNSFGFLKVENFDDNIRNNSRRRTLDQNMSEVIFNRLKHFIPLHTITIDECRWDLYRFLDFWRYLKYQQGQLFQTHYDGSKKFLDEANDIYEMSVYTLNIYLNDGFQGGSTRFFMNCKENAKVYDNEEAGPVTHTVSPKQGHALIFNHCNKGYLHDGEPLDVEHTETKEKYLLRADLIYRLRAEDVPKLKKKIQEGSCRFWSTENAMNGLVEDYVGNKWKCACVAKHVK